MRRQIIAPMLIILRVAQGKAWPAGTNDVTSSNALVQSPFVAEIRGRRSSFLFSVESRSVPPETVTLPGEVLGNTNSASTLNSVKTHI